MTAMAIASMATILLAQAIFKHQNLTFQNDNQSLISSVFGSAYILCRTFLVSISRDSLGNCKSIYKGIIRTLSDISDGGFFAKMVAG